MFSFYRIPPIFTTREQVVGKVHALWRGPFRACRVVGSLGGNQIERQVRERLHAIFYINMVNKQNSILSHIWDIMQKCFLCVTFCLVANLAHAWTAPNSVAKTITLQVGKSIDVNPRGVFSSINDDYITGTGYGNYDNTALSVTVASTKSVYNSALQKTENYCTYKIQANKVGTYTLRMNVGFYVSEGYRPVKTYSGSVHVDYTINIVDVNSISIPSNMSLKLGEQSKITPTLYPTGSQSSLKWQSDNPAIATVSDGLVKAVGLGTTTIKCTASNGVSAQCLVTVSPITVQSISLNHSEFEMLTNATDQLTATVSPSNATNPKVKWTSSNELVALVGDNGLVRAIAPGYAKITATATDGSGVSVSCIYHVSDPFVSVESIKFENATLQLEQGQSMVLSVDILPTNATNKNVVWESSNPSCVSVADDGTVSAINVGKATITATTMDDSKLAASCVIEVKPQNVETFDNIVYFKKSKLVANSTTTIPLYLNNKNEITAVQFDMILPEGITVGEVSVNEADGRGSSSTHTVGVSVLENGQVRVLCYSPSLSVFSGETGAILNIPLNVAENVENGCYYISFNNIVLTEKSGEKHSVSNYASAIEVTETVNGDCNGDGAVDVADIVAVANHILGNSSASFIVSAADVNGDGAVDVADIVSLANLLLHPQNARCMRANAHLSAKSSSSNIDALRITPFVLAEGGASETLSMDLYNTTEDFTAFQCDLYLPEGITVDKNKKGTAYKISFNQDEERTDASCHTLSAALQKDGAIRMICYSMNNDVFTGLEGALVDIPLTSENTMKDGFYNFTIKNVVLTHTDGTKVCPKEYKGTIVIGDGGNQPNVSMFGAFSSESLKNISNALSNNQSILSIDMTEVEDIESGSSLKTANPNTLFYVPDDMNLSNINNVVIGTNCSSLHVTDGFGFGTVREFKAVNARYVRTMPAMKNGIKAKWGTIAMPFDLYSNETVKYYQLVSVNKNISQMSFEPVDKVEVGTPAVFELMDNASELVVNTVNSTVCGSAINAKVLDNWSMSGAFQKQNLDPFAADYRNMNIYYIADNSFWYANQTFEVDAFRGWFETSANLVNAAPMYSIGIDGNGTTGINGIIRKDKLPKVFSLSGVRMNAPVKGKVNIINNKKVMVK